MGSLFWWQVLAHFHFVAVGAIVFAVLGAGNAFDIGNRTDRLCSTQNISLCIREKRVRVKKIWSAEQVKQQPSIVVKVAEKLRRPVPDLRELLLFEPVRARSSSAACSGHSGWRLRFSSEVPRTGKPARNFAVASAFGSAANTGWPKRSPVIKNNKTRCIGRLV